MDESSHRKKADQLFGQIALQLKIVTQRQLEQGLEFQRQTDAHKPLGLVMMQLGFVTQTDLDRIVEAQKELLAQRNGRAEATRKDSLFGKVAVRLGFVTQDQVSECLLFQEQLPKDRFMRLGDVMVLKGMLNVEQVRKIVDTQRGLVLYCPTCETQYNVVMFRPGASLQCYRCGCALRIPARLPAADGDNISWADADED